MLKWERGKYAGVPGALVLGEAQRLGWTLVTYDQTRIPPVLKTWAQDGVDHGGMIFLDDRRFPQRDLGAVLKALLHVWKQERDHDWTDRVVYLDRAPE